MAAKIIPPKECAWWRVTVDVGHTWKLSLFNVGTLNGFHRFVSFFLYFMFLLPACSQLSLASSGIGLSRLTVCALWPVVTIAITGWCCTDVRDELPRPEFLFCFVGSARNWTVSPYIVQGNCYHTRMLAYANGHVFTLPPPHPSLVVRVILLPPFIPPQCVVRNARGKNISPFQSMFIQCVMSKGSADTQNRNSCVCLCRRDNVIRYWHVELQEWSGSHKIYQSRTGSPGSIGV